MNLKLTPCLPALDTIKLYTAVDTQGIAGGAKGEVRVFADIYFCSHHSYSKTSITEYLVQLHKNAPAKVEAAKAIGDMKLAVAHEALAREYQEAIEELRKCWFLIIRYIDSEVPQLLPSPPQSPVRRIDHVRDLL